MNIKSLMLMAVVAVAAGGLLAACGGHDSNDSSMPKVRSVNSAKLLKLAKSSSETATPFAVNDGAFVFTDTSDSSDAIVVNAH